MNTRPSSHLRGGQALLEYVLALAGVLAVAVTMWYFIAAGQSSSRRAHDLMASERI